MATYTDSFTYSDNDNLATASSGTWALADSAGTYNLVNCNSGHFAARFSDVGGATARYTTAISGDHYSQANIFGTFGSGTARRRGVTVKDNAGTNASRSCYAAYIGNVDGTGNKVTLAKVGAYGTAVTVLTTYAITYSSGATLKLEATGTSPVVLTAYYNGVALGSPYSDSSSPLSGTYVGVFAATEDNSFYGDSWEGGDLAPATTKYLKLLAHSSAASATSIAGVVFSAPTGGNITGTTRYGEFTGAAFEGTLESGQAVLKVAVADFGGSALTTSDTPVALVRNSTYTTGAVSCTVIEE